MTHSCSLVPWKDGLAINRTREESALDVTSKDSQAELLVSP